MGLLSAPNRERDTPVHIISSVADKERGKAACSRQPNAAHLRRVPWKKDICITCAAVEAGKGLCLGIARSYLIWECSGLTLQRGFLCFNHLQPEKHALMQLRMPLPTLGRRWLH